jgi:hypothetical protein
MSLIRAFASENAVINVSFNESFFRTFSPL